MVASTVEDIVVTMRDHTVAYHLEVWAASWSRDLRVYTVDCRNPESGIGEVYSYPAGAVKHVRSTRRRLGRSPLTPAGVFVCVTGRREAPVAVTFDQKLSWRLGQMIAGADMSGAELGAIWTDSLDTEGDVIPPWDFRG